MKTTIAIPQANADDCWDGTTGVTCPCGGTIAWAEAGYAPGHRACRSCLALYRVRGTGPDRILVAQTLDGGIVGDAGETCADEDIYRVPSDLYPHFYQPATA